MKNIEEFTYSYQDFRDNKRLRKNLYRQEGKKVYACALGAFLGANHYEQAIKTGCSASVMPEWLVGATPPIFDYGWRTAGFHLKWADAVYLPGGLVDRANQLPEAKRKKLYAQAEKEIVRRYSCQVNRDFAHTEISSAFYYLADSGYAHQAAGTIIHVLDELLEAAGV